MMTPCVTLTDRVDGNGIAYKSVEFCDPSVLAELRANNCTMPNIERVIFNLKTSAPKRDAEGKKVRDENGNVVMESIAPILTTRVQYIDGTYTIVQNSKTDKIGVVTVMLDADGNVTNDPAKKAAEVLDATNASKEIAITYSIFKRICGKVLPSGEVVGNGTGRILNEIVDNAYNTPVEEAKQKLQKAAAKKRHADAAKNAAPKRERKSLYATVEKLDEVVTNMQNMFADVMSKVSK